MVEFGTSFDGRRASTILRIDELCSRSGGDAREAMTVGCKPTRTPSAFRGWVRVRVLGYGFGVRGKKVKSRDCALASDLVRAWPAAGEKF